ncbi:MAG: ATP-binding cassette domain-containing protein [Bacillota bacterium]
MISVHSLSKSFGQLLAVDRVSFTVGPGEVFGLLGENGAGKTTTLRMLATVLRPTQGSATIMGHDLIREPLRVRQIIGVLSAETGLYDRLTAWENVRYFGRLHGMGDAQIRQRSAPLADSLDMASFWHRRAGTLSKGMRQKVCIVRAVIHDPAVLLMDEPTAGLDVTSARAVHDFIHSWKREGRSILFSSHVMSEVEKVCDRIAVIHRGRIVAAGSLDEVKAQAPKRDLEEIFVRLVGETA